MSNRLHNLPNNELSMPGIGFCRMMRALVTYKAISIVTSGDNRMKTYQKTAAAMLVIIGTLMLAACPPRVSIGEINRDPGRYANRDVSITGRVTNSFGALGSGAYEVDDGTGTMWVFSQNFGVPGNGAKVAVTGRLQQGFTFGGRSFAVILRQTENRH